MSKNNKHVQKILKILFLGIFLFTSTLSFALDDHNSSDNNLNNREKQVNHTHDNHTSQNTDTQKE